MTRKICNACMDHLWY